VELVHVSLNNSSS